MKNNGFSNEWYQEYCRAQERRKTQDRVDSGGKPSEPECVIRHESLGKNEVKETNSGKVQIRYTSVCKRLLDPDNPTAKYHTDFLRYAKLIKGDSHAEVEIITTQRKCLKNETPHTIIEIQYPHE